MIRLKELENIVVDGIDYKDYPDFCDAYVSQASWKSNGQLLSEEECENIDESDINEFIHSNNAEMRSYLIG